MTLHQDSGVKIVSDSQKLGLLIIVDKSALNHAIEEFINAHTWRSEFVAANNKPLWWNVDMVSAYTKTPTVEEIDFGGVYKLHALLIKPENKQIKIEVWGEER